MTLVNQILQFLGPGVPPPYNPLCDINRDGFITVVDFLQALAML